MSVYGDDVVEYIKNNVKGKNIHELKEGVYKSLGKEITLNQIRRIKRINGLKSGKTSQRVWCKGTKGLVKPNSGSFKKGNMPKNTLDLGEERIYRGYICIKTGTGKGKENFTNKNRVLWEQYNNQKVPDGYRVMFADGDRNNFSKENLLLVSDAENFQIRRQNLRFDDSELTATGLNIVRLKNKLKEIEKNGR